MEAKLKGSSKPQIHICPIAGTRVIGSCPNYECPANLVRLTGGKKSGCFHEKYKASVTDFSILWSISQKQAQAIYSSSVSQLEKMTKLYQFLQEMRESCKWKYSCHNCGAPLEKNYLSCLNSAKCSHRAKLIHKQKSRVPFSLPGLNLCKLDIWMFIRHRTKAELRQQFGVYFPDALWNLLPPLILQELSNEGKH